MKKLIILLFVLNSLNTFSQGEANYWFFGQNAGIDFNSETPTPINGSLSTNEGCASFSAADGTLLFYSDGIKVWDTNGDLMPNGKNLLGDPSSTQSAIIVPRPGLGNEHLFYIFTVGANDYDNDGNLINPTEGLHCYTVDMNLNGGLGDIAGSAIDLSIGKNAEWTEKITSVKGADCNTWIISLVNNTFITYKIDNSGLINSAITSPVNFNASDPRGYLKVSPDGKRIASATYGEGKLYLYSFDDASGIVSNDGILLITNPEIDGYSYGIEFSPQSTKLYCSTFNGVNENRINKLFQFDLENTNIVSSKYLVKSQPGYRGALQLAPNGKIYATVPINYSTGTSSLDAINSPDKLGTNCNYKLDALNLGSGRAMQGLPPFIASLLLPIEITSVENNYQIITNQTLKLCVGSDYTFNAEDLPENFPTYSWTRNGIDLNQNSSRLTFTNIQLADAGIYELEVIIDVCGFPTIYKGRFEIETYIPPNISTSFIYEQCDIDTNSTDGVTLFNLNTKISEIINSDTNLEVQFFESQTDIDNNTPIANPSEYTSENNSQIFIKVTNTQSGCFTTGGMELNVYPTSLDIYANYYECENDISLNNDLKSIGNGNATFDFEIKRQEILAIFSDPSIEVEFYKNTNDAQLQINSLQGNIDFSSKEIIVRISNKLSKNCISVGKFDLILNPIPIPNGSDEEIILCVSNPRDNPQLFTTYLDGNMVDPNDTYQWYFNNNSISGATNSFYEANAEGTYKVEVTHISENDLTNPADDSLCKGFNSFIIVESNPPTIQINDITVEDDSNNNTITISTNNLGLGDYEYSLIDINGAVEYNYQNEPFFNNVPPGIHKVFINDKNCGSTSIDVSVIGYPKFFTPNNDGINDTWKVLGVNESFYPNSNIYIFDRFGKLITQINPEGNGWNGLFNGQPLPASDYWFSVELIDAKGNIRTKKGHFSIIRR